jgi:hypothetical protein
VTTDVPSEKEEAPLSYAEAVQIAKGAAMSSSDIARCQRLAASQRPGSKSRAEAADWY